MEGDSYVGKICEINFYIPVGLSNATIHFIPPETYQLSKIILRKITF